MNCETKGNHSVPDSVSITFDTNTETYHVTVDQSEGIKLSVALIQATAAITGVKPVKMEPLLTRIDPESVDKIYDPDRYSLVGEPVLSFMYAGCLVTIESPTELTIDP